MTRRGVGEAASGRQTESVRQSSLPTSEPFAWLLLSRHAFAVVVLRNCVHAALGSVASIVPATGVFGTGRRQRRLPIGGSAKGMPRNFCTPPTVVPCTVPVVVTTVCASAG